MLGKKKSTRQKIFDLKMEMRKPQRKLNLEANKLDTQISQLTAEIKKADSDIARRNFAKALIKAKRAQTQMLVASAEIESITNTLADQMSTSASMEGIAKVNGLTEKMQRLYNLPQIKGDITKLGQQMTKMKIMDEMITDTFDSAIDVDEEVVDEEVENVILKLTKDKMKNAPNASKEKLPSKQTVKPDISELEDDLLTSRLESLLN